MRIYTACKSGIIQRGEEIFPIAHMGKEREYIQMAVCMDIIPEDSERFMTSEEILGFYD